MIVNNGFDNAKYKCKFCKKFVKGSDFILSIRSRGVVRLCRKCRDLGK